MCVFDMLHLCSLLSTCNCTCPSALQQCVVAALLQLYYESNTSKQLVASILHWTYIIATVSAHCWHSATHTSSPSRRPITVYMRHIVHIVLLQEGSSSQASGANWQTVPHSSPARSPAVGAAAGTPGPKSTTRFDTSFGPVRRKGVPTNTLPPLEDFHKVSSLFTPDSGTPAAACHHHNTYHNSVMPASVFSMFGRPAMWSIIANCQCSPISKSSPSLYSRQHSC